MYPITVLAFRYRSCFRITQTTHDGYDDTLIGLRGEELKR